jgi:hypothetical protein
MYPNKTLRKGNFPTILKGVDSKKGKKRNNHKPK